MELSKRVMPLISIPQTTSTVSAPTPIGGKISTATSAPSLTAIAPATQNHPKPALSKPGPWLLGLLAILILATSIGLWLLARRGKI
jgi:hypothetical protein